MQAGVVVNSEIEIRTAGRGFHELTGEVATAVTASGVASGLCSLFIRHTSASLIVCENADPQVLSDLANWMERLVSDGDPLFRHTAEGSDDMPAHVRSVLTQSDLALPIRGGRLALGTWQGIFLWEHRVRAHDRRVDLTLVGAAQET